VSSRTYRRYICIYIYIIYTYKAIPVTGRGGSESCETSSLPHFLDNRFRDGGEAVSLTRRPRFKPRKFMVLLISVRG
jgi:hypothetical protein